MHSGIFQISVLPLTQEEFVSVDNIERGDMVSMDYAYDISAEERIEKLQTLVRHILPKGMFELDIESAILTYKGGIEAWKKQQMEILKERAGEVKEENMIQWIGPAYQLQKAIVNPLDTSFVFITEACGSFGVAERSRDLMIMANRLKEGDKLFVGAVYGYHY